jgi:hypothetical protein
MTTGTKMFAAMAAFLAGIAIVYWFISYEEAGTVLLGFGAMTSGIVAGYAARRGSLRAPNAAAEDRPDARPDELAGEEIGSFPLSSPWPLVFAVAMVFVGAGLLYALVLLPVGVILAAISVLGFMRESVS